MTTMLPSPQSLRERAVLLDAKRRTRQGDVKKAKVRATELRQYLDIAPKVEAAIETLSQELFSQLTKVLEEKLTIMLQEVLCQPIRLRATSAFRRGSMNVDFSLEREGNSIDVMDGSGGSVANVLSIGLRLFALTTLDPTSHRRFLVLDEQDCWLKPELVPALVKIVHEAGKALGFQVLMISHHSPDLFSRYAERLYILEPQADGSVAVKMHQSRPVEPDNQNT